MFKLVISIGMSDYEEEIGDDEVGNDYDDEVESSDGRERKAYGNKRVTPSDMEYESRSGRKHSNQDYDESQGSDGGSDS